MNIEAAKQLYPEARELAGLVSEEWQESYNLEKSRAEVCLRDTVTAEIYPIAQILPACSYDDRRLIFRANILLISTVTVCEAAFAKIRELERQLGKQETKDYAAEVSIKCQKDQAFRRYLMECHDLHDAGDADRIKTRVRSILAVSSMTELNTDPDAGARWVSLRKNFKSWLRDKR